ncbi:glycosyltransferase [Halohasta salina]|uniref:glycosyltransferase n=1 Tax=Halohasta salina TaxID=2961621 RepID=UPI0020A5F385|nr:glycosyltransferase [Halohasta salina]
MSDALGVVIPAYEPDVDALAASVGAIRSALDPVTVRIEIDAPSESTLARVEPLADELGVARRRRGKGGAIMDGFDELSTAVLAFVDADGSVPAASLADIVDHVRQRADTVAIGSRRHPEARIVDHQTVGRRLLGDAFAVSARKLLPTACYDYQCGAKALRAEAWAEIGHHCYESGFAWDLEFVAVTGALGYRITEVPVTWEDHPESTVDPLSTSLELGRALFDVRRRAQAIATSPRYRDVQPTHGSTLSPTTDGD